MTGNTCKVIIYDVSNILVIWINVIAYQLIALRKTRFIVHFHKIMKILTPSIFSFIILNLVKKGILEFDFTTATRICMKNVIDNSICLKNWTQAMDKLKLLILNITALNLVNQ